MNNTALRAEAQSANNTHMDVDEAALTYAEVKALATGNPYIKEKMDLKQTTGWKWKCSEKNTKSSCGIIWASGKLRLI